MRTPAGFLLPDEKLLYVVLDALHVVRIIQFSSTQQHNATEQKMELYVYSNEDEELVAVIEGQTNAECEKQFLEQFDMNDFSASYCEK